MTQPTLSSSLVCAWLVLLGACRSQPSSAPLSPEAATPAPSARPAAPLADAGRALPEVAARTPAANVPRESLDAAVRANNQFGVALYGRVRLGQERKNLLTSPISASLALSMAALGARGETQSEMATALGFAANDMERIAAGQNALGQALSERGPAALAASSRGSRSTPVAADHVLHLVNSLWGEASFGWAPEYTGALQREYGAELRRVDFLEHAEGARTDINAWVSAQTADKIRDLLPQGSLDSATRLVLVNALHVKLPWDKPFSASATAAAPFTRSDRRALSVPTMRQTTQLPYLDDGSAQVVALPLVGRQLSVLIVLPHAGVSLEKYAGALRAGATALGQPPRTELVELSLPKLSFTSDAFSLRDALKALGMKRAFESGRAEFDGMCSSPAEAKQLSVQDVLQKTRIALDESGLEAAAATAVTMVAASAPLTPPKPVAMRVNRPFLIAIVDVPTGALLMLGQIDDPSL